MTEDAPAYTAQEQASFEAHFQPKKRGRGRPKGKKNAVCHGAKRTRASMTGTKFSKVPAGEQSGQQHLNDKAEVVDLTASDKLIEECKPVECQKQKRTNWDSPEYKPFVK